MYLKDFVTSRNVPYQTVNSYIRRNSSQFSRHKKIKNGKIWLSKNAIEILSNQYPLEADKQSKTERELIEAQQTIIKLQALLYESQSKLMVLEGKEDEYRHLENRYKDSTRLLSEYKEKAEILEKEAEYSDIQIQLLDDKIESLEVELGVLEKSLIEKEELLNYEKSKTWWDKLRGK